MMRVFMIPSIGIVVLLLSSYVDHATCGHDPQDHVHADLVMPSVGQPLPKPQQYTSTETYFTLQPGNFSFYISTLPKCDILLKGVERYQKIIFRKDCTHWSAKKFPISNQTRKANVGELKGLKIIVSGKCEKYPYMDMDEQYRLKINDPDKPNEAVLFSNTVWGALRGLQTFSQLVYEVQPGQFTLNTTSILDFPRFSFRGILLDTSRHFVPVPVLLQNLDAMTDVKMNVFHWHITDDQSFPYVSKKFPDLSKMGAYDPVTHIYSQQDVADVIEYARLRGIRVLAEFDTPGHTLSWGKGQLDILTQCFDKEKPIPGSFGPLDPSSEKLYPFIQDFFTEVTEVFPDSYVHLGGDEVDFTCWKSNPTIQTFMEKQKFGKDYSKLEQFYVQKILDIVKSLNKSYIVWQEVFDNKVKVNPDTVIHVWKGGYVEELQNVTAAGLKTILSSCWYLNYIGYGNDWPQYYKCDPQDFNGTDAQKKLVIGGEACMWGEYVDRTNLLSRTWPRAAVVAERLWSAKTVTDENEVIPRLEQLRCKMLKNGLRVEPINGPGFCPCDYL